MAAGGTSASISPPAGVSALPSFSEVRVGVRFGPSDDQHEVDAELGGGATARVFACRRLRTGEELAVKAVDLRRLRLLNDAEGHMQRIDREVRILKRLRHERIVELRSVHRTQNWYFLVMERVWGGELFSHIVRQGCLGEPEARRIFQQLLEGVLYMHSRSVIHRDLKPENILIVKSNSAEEQNLVDVKIADFGLSKVICDGASLAKTFVGTPQYWAPEVLRVHRGGGTYGQEADLWGLGAVLFVMLSGRYPFDGRKVPLEEQIQKAGYNMRTTRWRGVSEDAKDLVRSLLRVQPDERLCLDGCLSHPWVTGVSDPRTLPASSSSSKVEGRRPADRPACDGTDRCLDAVPPPSCARATSSSPSSEERRRRDRHEVDSNTGWGCDELLGAADQVGAATAWSSDGQNVSQDHPPRDRDEDEDWEYSDEEDGLLPALSDSVEEVTPAVCDIPPLDAPVGRFTKMSSKVRRVWSGWAGWVLVAALLADATCRLCLSWDRKIFFGHVVRESEETKTVASGSTDADCNSSQILLPLMSKPMLSLGSSLGTGMADSSCREQESIFRLQELLRLQVSIAGSLEVTVLAFRRADAELAEAARNTYEEARDLFQRAASLVSQFAQVARQVSDSVLPDLQLAVEEQEPNLALQLLVMVKSWVADMKRDGEDMQGRYEKLHATVTGLATRAQRSKAGSDERLAESMRRTATRRGTSAAVKVEEDIAAASKTTTASSVDSCAADVATATSASSQAAAASGAGPGASEAARGLTPASQAVQAVQGGQKEAFDAALQGLFEKLLKLHAEAAKGAGLGNAAAPVGGILGPLPLAPTSASAEVSSSTEEDAWKQDVMDLLFMAPGALRPTQLLPAPEDDATSFNLTDAAGCGVPSASDADGASSRENGHSHGKSEDVAVVRYGQAPACTAPAAEKAAESSLALLHALRELRRVGAILQGCSAFWASMDSTVQKLAQMKEHTEALVRFSGSNARLRQRFETRLQEYAGFWASLERLCRRYAMDHEAASARMQEFMREVRDIADAVDTAMSIRAGARAAAADVAVTAGAAAHGTAVSMRASGAHSSHDERDGDAEDDLYEEVRVEEDTGYQLVVAD